ncbi:hypothetical protein SAMN05444007_101420 [Cribrihabitans marinus]|uniref:Uncharacterized protein n=1 Tax=Cribrihabitans marinus TaxID=1227549 RepID=A0A1H6RIP8_9RHOB|nr:hypothetical protein [Cribrihabitans marinus]GGH20581.1 hypothetical protein GCM10010973_04620 [Cribrihabitans marinus]SEI51465.1 hypothetical protein SAMN05444007_101420 [Cribrihabitans marinus]
MSARRKIPSRLLTLAFLVLAACETQTTAPAGPAPPGAAFATPYGTRVYQVSDAVFEVVPFPLAGTDEYWCGAAEYARRRLGADWSDQLYIVRGVGRSAAAGGRSSVQFTLTPEAVGVTPIDLQVRTGFKVGDHQSVTRGHGLCPVFPPFVV